MIRFPAPLPVASPSARLPRGGGLALVLLAALSMAACGDDTPPAEPLPEEMRTPEIEDPDLPPRSGPVTSPPAAVPLDAAGALSDLRRRVAEGGLTTEDDHQAVSRVAELLWETAAGEVPPPAAQTHHQVARVAGDAARWVAQGGEGLAALRAKNPVDFEIHGAFLAASAEGPAAYRAWCEQEAPALLTKMREHRIRMLSGG